MKSWPLLVALGLGLAGCGTPKAEDPPAGEPVVLQFWNGFSGPDGDTMIQMVRRFNEEHDDIEVKMQIIPWGTYYDKVTLGLAYGGAPDVFVLHVNRFPEYANHGVLGELAGLEADRYVPAAWEACQWQGRTLAMPLDIHPLGLYYNRRLFREAGIAAPPTTYAEFLESAKKLTKDRDGDGKIDQWGFSFTWLRSNGLTFLNQHGTSLLTEDLSQSGLSTPGARAAMDQMLDIVEKHRVAPRPEGQDAWMGFQAGKVAMAMEGVYMNASLEKLEDFDYAAAPVPQFGPKPGVWAGSHLLVTPAELPPRRREAAHRFIRYLSDHSLAWAKGGQVPARIDLLASREFMALPVQSQFARQLDRIIYEPPSVSFNLVAGYMDSAIEAVVNRTTGVDRALDDATRRIDNVLARSSEAKP